MFTEIAAKKLKQALNAARCFHEHRDEMNAALHMQPVVYSALTKALQEAANIADICVETAE